MGSINTEAILSQIVSYQGFFMIGSFVVIALVLVGIVWSMHRNDNSFHVYDWFVDSETGKASVTKLGQFVSLIVSSWIIGWQTVDKVLTIELFMVYLGVWSGAKIVSDFVKLKWGTKNDDNSTKSS